MAKKAETVWDVRSGKVGLHQFMEALLARHIEKLRQGEQIVKVINQPMETPPEFVNTHRPKIFFQLAGRNHVTYPGGETIVEPGEMLIIQARTPHRERRIFQRKRYAHIFSNLSAQRYGYNAFVLCSDPAKRQHHIASAYTDNVKNAFVLQMLNELCENAASDEPTARTLVQTLAQGILLQLAMVIQNPHWEGREHPLIARCKGLIHDQLQNTQLTVSQLADSLQVHPDYLSRVFSEQEQQRLVAYIVECRIKLAQEILRSLSVRIEEVAALSGFAERGYFAKVFKRSTGMTPSEYRSHAHRGQGAA